MQRTNEEGAVSIETAVEKPVKRKPGRPKKDIESLKKQIAVSPEKRLHNHPDPAISQAITTMALAGFSQADICKVCKISAETIAQYYHDEATHGRQRVMAEVVGSLAQRAIAGSDTAAIWLTKTRLGWSDRQQVDVNANIEVVHHRGELMSELTGLIQKGITIDAEPIPENPGKTDSDPQSQG